MDDGDCDDADFRVRPQDDEVFNRWAREDPCPCADGIDNDCDGEVDEDECPDIVELCDGLDNDCDGNVDEGVQTLYYRDADDDGYGDPSATTEGCEKPDGYVPYGTDCDDQVSTVYPGAEEDCDNGIDDDCDGSIDNCDQDSGR